MVGKKVKKLHETFSEPGNQCTAKWVGPFWLLPRLSYAIQLQSAAEKRQIRFAILSVWSTCRDSCWPNECFPRTWPCGGNPVHRAFLRARRAGPSWHDFSFLDFQPFFSKIHWLKEGVTRTLSKKESTTEQQVQKQEERKMTARFIEEKPSKNLNNGKSNLARLGLKHHISYRCWEDRHHKTRNQALERHPLPECTSKLMHQAGLPWANSSTSSIPERDNLPEGRWTYAASIPQETTNSAHPMLLPYEGCERHSNAG